MAGFKLPFFKEHPAKAEARRLLETVSGAARDPALYGAGRAPDTFDGRFQLLALHGAIALRRLRADPAQARLLQAFTDELFLNFDDGLREAGIGDLSVAKHMKKIGKAFYGRFGAYDEALAAGDRVSLESALSRNVWNEEAAAFAPSLAERALTLAARLGSLPVEQILSPEAWRC